MHDNAHEWSIVCSSVNSKYTYRVFQRIVTENEFNEFSKVDDSIMR